MKKFDRIEQIQPAAPEPSREPVDVAAMRQHCKWPTTPCECARIKAALDAATLAQQEQQAEIAEAHAKIAQIAAGALGWARRAEAAEAAQQAQQAEIARLKAADREHFTQMPEKETP